MIKHKTHFHVTAKVASFCIYMQMTLVFVEHSLRIILLFLFQANEVWFFMFFLIMWATMQNTC